MILDEDQALVLAAAEIYRNIPISLSKAFSKAHALECAGIPLKRAQDREYQLAIVDAPYLNKNCLSMEPCGPEERFKLLWPRIKVFLYAKKKTIAGVMRLAGYDKDEIKPGAQYQRCYRWVNSQKKKKNVDTNAEKAPYKPYKRLLSLLSPQEKKKKTAPTVIPAPAVLPIAVKILDMKEDCNLVSPLTCYFEDTHFFEDGADVSGPFVPTLDTLLAEDELPAYKLRELEDRFEPSLGPVQGVVAPCATISQEEPRPCESATSAASQLTDGPVRLYSEKQTEALRVLAVELGTHLLCEVQKMEVCPPQFRTAADVAAEMNKLFGVDLLQAAGKK